MNKAFIGVVAVTSSMLAISMAHGSMRCPDGGDGSCVVSVGDDKSALYSCCGSPDVQSSNVKFVGNDVSSETVNVDSFTYNCGEGRFIMKITMENDKIRSIQNAGHGSGPQKCD